MENKMNKNNDNMVFAIFGDGEFIAWTYGLFMSLTNEPKIYGFSEKQIEIVKSNFNSKISKINKVSDIDFNNPVASAILNSGQNRDKNKLSNFNNFELRMYKTNHTYETWVDDINKENPNWTFKY